MRKTTSLIAIATLSASVLAGCNADNDNRIDTNMGNDTRPIGYYTNDEDLGNQFINNDNNGLDREEGPLTDMMDNDNNNNNNNFARTDRNQDNQNITRNGSYTGGYDGELADRLEDRIRKIDNVKDARVIITDESVLVGIDSQGERHPNVERDVRNTVKKMTNKDVRVATDSDMFNRIGAIGNDLRNGNAFQEVESDVNNILEDLGDVVQRPFQNNK